MFAEEDPQHTHARVHRDHLGHYRIYHTEITKGLPLDNHSQRKLGEAEH